MLDKVPSGTKSPENPRLYEACKALRSSLACQSADGHPEATKMGEFPSLATEGLGAVVRNATTSCPSSCVGGETIFRGTEGKQISSKMNERTGNIYENKGSVLNWPRLGGNVVENKGLKRHIRECT